MRSQIYEKDEIRLWKACKDVYYAKIPYGERGLMNRRKPVLEYYRNGRMKYLQYEISVQEAEKLIQNLNIFERRGA